MNAMKFVALLIFVGVVCANVCARQLEEVSKETNLGISIPKTVTTNGIGAKRDYVSITTTATNTENSDAGAAAGPRGPSADTSSRVYKSTSESVTAEGPNARARGYSYTSGSTRAGAAAGPNGAGSSGDASGVAYSEGEGATGTGA